MKVKNGESMKNEIKNVTVNAIATTDNANKTNKLLSVSELTVLFTDCQLLPRFVCDGYYVGCGIGRTNVFSVNTRSKWSTYKVFCDNDRFNQIKSKKFDNVTCTENGNSTDKIRCNVVEIKTTDTLKKVLKFVASQNKSLCMSK